MSDTPKKYAVQGKTLYVATPMCMLPVGKFDKADWAKEICDKLNSRPALVEALEGLLAIIDDCDPCDGGIMGYHLNGDIAHWGEFEEIETARAALLAAKGGE